MQVPPPELVPVAMGAFNGALAGETGLLDVQTTTMRAVAAALGFPGTDPASFPALSPAEVADAVGDDGLRRQLIQGMVVLAFLEHPPSEDRLRAIKAYAKQLGIDEKTVKIFGDYVHDRTRLMLFDIVRHVPFAEWDRQFAKEEGLGTMIRATLATFDKAEAPEVTAKFRRLESCPEGSLGRKLWEMYEREGWALPGERHAVPEATTVHDWVHVLSGYAPTPIGEIQVTTFMAAGSDDPRIFGTLMLSLGLYEAAAFKPPIFTDKPSGNTMQQPHAPEAFADALRRGLATNEDLLVGIDHWALANEPVAALRERYHVIPKDEPEPTADPGA
jgi:hypothetical protein